jgi:recombination protein RecA
VKAKASAKDAAFQEALKNINSTFGEATIIQLGKVKPRPPRAAFSTGCLSLDIMLNGGFPREMITELYGPEGGGKSTLALTACGLAQAQGERVAYVDVEHAFDPSYARKLGVDADNLAMSQPESAEEALQIVEILVESGAVGIIVVDSVAMLTPRAEIEGEIGDSNVALIPRIMAQALRRLTVKVRKNNVALIFINQLRELINQYGHGEKTTTPGGRALKHAASLRLDVRRIAGLKIGDRVIGARVRAKNPKSRVCNPYQEVEFDLIYGEGIDREADLLDLSEKMKIVIKDGNSYSFKNERIGNGRLKACKALKGNRELFSVIRGLVVEQTANGASTEPEEAGEPVNQ